VVNPDQSFGFFGELRDQPFSNSFARPVLSRTWRRLDLMGNGHTVRLIHAQAREALRRRLRARIVDTNVALECRIHLKDSLMILLCPLLLDPPTTTLLPDRQINPDLQNS